MLQADFTQYKKYFKYLHYNFYIMAGITIILHKRKTNVQLKNNSTQRKINLMLQFQMIGVKSMISKNRKKYRTYL